MEKLTAFETIFARAAARKGGAEAFAATLGAPRPTETLLAFGDDRWLSVFSKFVFRTSLNWQVVENKWPHFEDVFHGFDPRRLALMSDDDLDGYLADPGLIRSAPKILSVRDNAALLNRLAGEHGSAAACFAQWPGTDFIGLLAMLRDRGSRLGGSTGMYALRSMGVDSFVLSKDVIRALQTEGVIEGKGTSKRELQAIQEAFNAWAAQSGRPLTAISRTLACSVA